MRPIYIPTLLIALLLLLAGCQDPVVPGFSDTANLHELSVYGMIVGDNPKEYKADIDEVAGTITIQIPYYISDTEPIQGDLTRMRVRADLPVGAKFEPGLQGIRDLSGDGFRSTLHYADGTSKTFTILAKSFKSPLAEITNIKLNNAASQVPFIYRISPKEEDGATVISVVQFGYSHIQVLKAADLSITTSPWATVTYPDGSPILDLTDESLSLRVVAQDGTTRTYRFRLTDPNYVPEGMPGSITPLFGVKVVKGDAYGWQNGQNRSLAVIGDELIIANLKGDLLRHDRFTGKPRTKTVSRTGITGDIHAIAHDAAGHLVAVTIASINNKWVPNHLLEIFVWKEGIEGTPTKIYSLDLQHDPLFAGKNPNANTARTIGIAGDILQGKARIGFVFNGLNELMVLSFQDGSMVHNSGLIAPSTGMTLTNASKCIPIGTADSDPVLVGMLYDRSMLKVAMDGNATKFASGSNWWTDNGNTKGLAYAHFNGMDLVALGNGQNAPWTSDIDWMNRLIVSNISDGSANALHSGEILDSYNLKYDKTSDKTSGNNDSDWGRLYGWLEERVGTNGNKVGDVAICVAPNGTTMQVYLMVTDMGFMGWEITKFAL